MFKTPDTMLGLSNKVEFQSDTRFKNYLRPKDELFPISEFQIADKVELRQKFAYDNFLDNELFSKAKSPEKKKPNISIEYANFKELAN